MARLGDVFECQITGEWGNECSENEIGTKVLRTTNFTPEGIINYDDVVIRSINETKVEKSDFVMAILFLKNQVEQKKRRLVV